MSEHLTEMEVDRFARGELAPDERRGLMRHLLSGCRFCRRKVAPLTALALEPETAEAAGDPDEYDEPIDRAFALVLARGGGLAADRQRVGSFLAALRAYPGGFLNLPRAEADRFDGWAAVEALLGRSFELRYSDPRAMVDLAWWAWVYAKSLDDQVYGPRFAADLRARTLAELGNAYRIADEFKKSEQALGEAEEHRRQGTGDLLLLARSKDLLASLRNDQRRFPEACSLLDEVGAIYREVGDPHLAGRAFFSKGIYIYYQGDTEAALRLLRDALSVLEPARDPHLAANARQFFATLLIELGEYTRAAAVLLESGLREAVAGDPLNEAKLRWLEGRIFAGLGRLGRAERIFQEVEADFLGHEQAYLAALVGLDLAEVYLRQGRAEELLGLAADMVATFEHLEIHREARIALRVFERACEMRATNVAILRHVRRFIERVERRPELVFDWP